MEKLQFDSGDYKLYSPDSLKYITDNMLVILKRKIEEYKQIFNINYFRKIELHFFDDKDEFRNYVYALRGERNSLPEYASGVFDNGKIIAFIPNNIIVGSSMYRNYSYMPSHELFHIMYKELIWEKNSLERIIWFDEGMAKYFSGELEYISEQNRFKDFFTKVKNETKIIPNLNNLKHGVSFVNENYNGYDLSFIGVKYIIDTLGLEEFKVLMKDICKIKKYGEHILNDAFEYFEKSIIIKNNK